MIVYRVADGKGWTKSTYTEATTSSVHTDGNVPLGSVFRIRETGSSTFADEPRKSIGTTVQVSDDAYTIKESFCDSVYHHAV